MKSLPYFMIIIHRLHFVVEEHGVHAIEHAEKIGLGSRKYALVSIDK